MSLLELFCHVDDFCQSYEAQQAAAQAAGQAIAQPLLLEDRQQPRQRRRAAQLCLSEVMTICIHFHQAHYRTFKHYYQEHVQVQWRGEFPGLVSYSRFVELMQRAALPLAVYLQQCYGMCSGISFIDSTTLAVCRQQRARRHRVFAGLAQRGKTAMGWFYGFKLHLVVNDEGELLACQLTPGNVDDRMPVPQLARRLFGQLFGDKGYLSHKLSLRLRREQGVELLTFLRRNMQGRLLRLGDALLLRKRAIIESVNDQLKNISQIEHSRHRSVVNFLVNLLCGLIAYCHQPKKPSLHLRTRPALTAA